MRAGLFAFLVVTQLAVSVRASQICSSLNQVIRESKSGYAHSIGSEQTILGVGSLPTNGYATSLKIGEFDFCSLTGFGLICLGPDINAEPERLEARFLNMYAAIKTCLGADEGTIHGWRVSRPFKSKSTGNYLAVFTDTRHFDDAGRPLHIALKIANKPDSEFRYLVLNFRYYNANKSSNDVLLER